jgi:hypothetical protein
LRYTCQMIVFKGKNGVRAGWRFLLFAATWYVLDNYVFGFIEAKLPDGLFAGLSPEGTLIGECFDLAAVLCATGLMAPASALHRRWRLGS